MKRDNSSITVIGAKEYNLKSINIEIPHNEITVVTGVSGSGKSSLVYDTICKEAQRRYLETYSSFAKQFLGKMERPAVTSISGLKPAIAIDQRTIQRSARFTVGTISELYSYLRLLFARLGKPTKDFLGSKINRQLFSFNSPAGYCLHCKGLGVEEKISQDLIIKDKKITLREGALVITTDSGYIIYSQVTMDVLNQVCKANGFNVDIPWMHLTEEQRRIVLYGSDKIIIPYGKHTLESRMKWSGITVKSREEGHYKGIIPVMEQILKRSRNKNILRFVQSIPCTSCKGARINKNALRVIYRGYTLFDFAKMTIDNLIDYFNTLFLERSNGSIERAIQREFLKKARLLKELGLGYLTLHRESTTLSRGESQRLRLANQCGSQLRNILYILDEPSIGLHSKDTEKLLAVIDKLKKNGNTLVVVEHDAQVIKAADYIIDIGPDAGIMGGKIIAQGKIDTFLKSRESKTAQYFNKIKSGNDKKFRKLEAGLEIVGAKRNNLQNLNINIPKNCIVAITGVSGSGKSTLIFEVLLKSLNQRKNVHCNKISGQNNFNSVIAVDQKRIGTTPLSNPATYTGVFDKIRDVFSKTSIAKEKSFKKNRFSFNVKGGRCEVCHGMGKIKISMDFLSDIWNICEACNGKRFNEKTLKCTYQDKNIFQVLDMNIDQVIEFFSKEKKINHILSILSQVGLGYLKLGQPTSTLSGGETQRLKLASEMIKANGKNNLYIFDEPTIGLHFEDVKKLLKVFDSLIEKGHSLIVIEHNEDIIRNSDWVIELGPGPGNRGGKIVFEGYPNKIDTPIIRGMSPRCEDSYMKLS